MEYSKADWLAEFAARRWVLVNALGPDPHLERAQEVYDSMCHMDPLVAAEEDLRANPENRWTEDSGWSTAL